ncbi:hypothetical protein [Candidatus Neoehrlichia procyonis]|nr:hypothetical protein [Candidatus Neoehrlichia lotoris]
MITSANSAVLLSVGLKFFLLVIFSIALYKLLIYLVNYYSNKCKKNTSKKNNSYTGYNNMASSSYKRAAVPVKQEIHPSRSKRNISNIESVFPAHTQKGKTR